MITRTRNVFSVLPNRAHNSVAMKIRKINSNTIFVVFVFGHRSLLKTDWYLVAVSTTTAKSVTLAYTGAYELTT